MQNQNNKLTIVKLVTRKKTTKFSETDYINKNLITCFSQDPKPIIVDRLFRGTLAIAYRQKNVTYQGPYPVGYRVKTSDSTLMLYLGHGNGHIDKKIDSGFEVN